MPYQFKIPEGMKLAREDVDDWTVVETEDQLTRFLADKQLIVWKTVKPGYEKVGFARTLNKTIQQITPGEFLAIVEKRGCYIAYDVVGFAKVFKFKPKVA